VRLPEHAIKDNQWSLEHAVAWMVEVLYYKPKGHGFDHWIFQVTRSFKPHYGPGVNSASNGNESWNPPGSKGWSVHKSNNLTAACELVA
jgi:hypothetical protein